MPMYDSYEGFSRAIKSLEGFNDIVEARHIAGYERNERLREWVVLGRYYFDSCGNTQQYVNDIIPAEKFPNIPMILTRKEYFAFIRENSQPGDDQFYTTAFGSGIPPADIHCPECGEKWCIRNCHDTIITHESKLIPLEDFANRPLSDIKARWQKTPDAVWRLQLEKSIRNPKYIDLTPDESDLGKKYGWVVNDLGWVEPTEDYIIQPGDEALVNVWTFRHTDCHKAYLAREERLFFEDIFRQARFKNVTLVDIPAQYEPSDRKAPWFNVLADGIPFTIGWRHRVIEINCQNKKIDFRKLFSDEDVTKGESFIHAWGKDKCIEYLELVRWVIKK